MASRGQEVGSLTLNTNDSRSFCFAAPSFSHLRLLIYSPQFLRTSARMVLHSQLNASLIFKLVLQWPRDQHQQRITIVFLRFSKFFIFFSKRITPSLALSQDLNEINRLLRAKTASKKCENAYEICRSLITIDFEQSSEVLFEHLSLLDSKQTADFLSLLIQLKQNDLPEIKLVAVLTSALKNFESLQFSSDNKSINATFASAIISNK